MKARRDRPRWHRRGWWVPALAAVLLVAGPGGAGGQEPAPARAPLWVTADHWVEPVLRRLSALGLIGGALEPGLPGVGRAEALRLLETAEAAAVARKPALVEAIAEARTRFEAEFPELSAGGARWRGGYRAGASLTTGDPPALTSVGTPPLVYEPWEPDPAAEQPDGETDAGVLLEARGYLGRWLAVEVAAAASPGELQFGDSYVAVAGPRVAAWAGRRRLSLGYGHDGIVVSGVVPLDGVGVVIEPFRLPWVLDVLGTIDASTSVAQLGHSAPYDDPWLWLLRVGIRPHDRLSLALHRGAMAVPVDGGFGDRLQQIAYIAIGKHLPETEENWRDNQMASVALRFRPPLGPVPVETWLEWGLDDSAGSWKDVPGIVAGAYLGALPGLPALGLGVEAAHFAPRCCGNIWWYRHSGFQGGWTDERQPLGHPLGGHGDQWTVRIDGGVSVTQLEGTLYWRRRGYENLFAPAFEGESRGGSVRVSAMPSPGLEVGGSAEIEGGDGWHRRSLRLWLGWIFR